MGVLVAGDHGVEHGEIDPLPGARTVPEAEGGQDGHQTVEPGEGVGDRQHRVDGRGAVAGGLPGHKS